MINRHVNTHTKTPVNYKTLKGHITHIILQTNPRSLFYFKVSWVFLKKNTLHLTLLTTIGVDKLRLHKTNFKIV